MLSTHSPIAADNTDFTKEINHFLIPYGIHFNYCSVFTDTLLQAAGVTSHGESAFYPLSSSSDIASFDLFNISENDALKFREFYLRLHDNNNDLTLAYSGQSRTAHISINKQILLNCLLPYFKEKFPSIDPLSFSLYKTLSAANITIQDNAALHSILTHILLFIRHNENDFSMATLNYHFAELCNAVNNHILYQLDVFSPEKENADNKLKQAFDNILAYLKRAFGQSERLQNIINSIQTYKWQHCPFSTNANLMFYNSSIPASSRSPSPTSETPNIGESDEFDFSAFKLEDADDEKLTSMVSFSKL